MRAVIDANVLLSAYIKRQSTSGRAACIISGDEDLQVLHPWRGVEILTPAQAIDRSA